MTCSLLFSKDTIPDPNQENEDDNCVGQVPYGYGEGEMTHILPTESGGYCYARNEEEEATGDVTGFTKIDSRKGWCYDANDHGFESCNYSADTKTKADVTAQECGVACQAMDMCIGFNYFDDSMTCSLLFSKDTIPDPNQENEDDNCVGQVPYGYGEGEMTHIFPTESGGYCYARNEEEEETATVEPTDPPTETTTVEPTDPPAEYKMLEVNVACDSAIKSKEECLSAFTELMGDSEFKDRTVKEHNRRNLPTGCYVNKNCDFNKHNGKLCRAHFNSYSGKRSKDKVNWAKMLCKM